jgi:integrase
LVRVFWEAKSPFARIQFIAPPHVVDWLRQLKEIDHPNLRPDKRDRITYASPYKGDTAKSRKSLSAFVDTVSAALVNAHDAAFLAALVNALLKRHGRQRRTITAYLAELKTREAELVAIAQACPNPAAARKAGGLQPFTARRYADQRRYFATWLAEQYPQQQDGLAVDEIDGDKLNLFQDWMRSRYSIATYRSTRAYFASAWESAQAKGYASSNPWKSTELKPARDPRKAWPILTKDQIAAIAALPDTWDGNALQVLMYTGARPSDLAWLQRGEVDFGKKEIKFTQPKTGETKTVDMIGGVEIALRRQLNTHSALWVFPRDDDQQADRRYLVKRLNRALKAVTVDGLSLYSLRRTAATLMLDAGVPLDIVRAWIGHLDESMIWTYSQQTRERRQDAATKFTERLRA